MFAGECPVALWKRAGAARQAGSTHWLRRCSEWSLPPSGTGCGDAAVYLGTYQFGVTTGRSLRYGMHTGRPGLTVDNYGNLKDGKTIPIKNR